MSNEKEILMDEIETTAEVDINAVKSAIIDQLVKTAQGKKGKEKNNISQSEIDIAISDSELE